MNMSLKITLFSALSISAALIVTACDGQQDTKATGGSGSSSSKSAAAIAQKVAVVAAPNRPANVCENPIPLEKPGAKPIRGRVSWIDGRRGVYRVRQFNLYVKKEMSGESFYAETRFVKVKENSPMRETEQEVKCNGAETEGENGRLAGALGVPDSISRRTGLSTDERSIGFELAKNAVLKKITERKSFKKSKQILSWRPARAGILNRWHASKGVTVSARAYRISKNEIELRVYLTVVDPKVYGGELRHFYASIVYEKE